MELVQIDNQAPKFVDNCLFIGFRFSYRLI